MPALGFESMQSFCQLIFGPPLDHSGALEHPEEQHFAQLTADQQVPGSNPGLPFLPCGWIPAAHHQPLVTAVGFEPTPLRTGALSQRLRPLGRPGTCVPLVAHVLFVGRRNVLVGRRHGNSR
jgi:hypothetical protein